MTLDDVLSPSLTVCHYAKGTHKKYVLELITKLACESDEKIDYKDVLSALMQRERIGSTVIGKGVAIPHARVKNLDHAICLLITLAEPIDFDDQQSEKVDVIFGLLVPIEADNVHVELLAEISKRLLDPAFCESLRLATTNMDLFDAAINESNILIKLNKNA